MLVQRHEGSNFAKLGQSLKLDHVNLLIAGLISISSKLSKELNYLDMVVLLCLPILSLTNLVCIEIFHYYLGITNRGT